MYLWFDKNKVYINFFKKELNSYESKLVTFELENYENHSKDIEKWHVYANTLHYLPRTELYGHVS